MKPFGKVRISLLIGGLVLAAGLCVGWFFLQPPRPEPLPNPNGYDDFVAAGEMVKGDAPDEKAGSLEECRAFVSANRAALDRGRLGLAKQCRVPTQYSNTWPQDHLEQLLATKKLARAFCVEAELAKWEKRPADATASYLNAIKMGAVLAHGGVMIDGLIASACEGEGVIMLAPEVENLDIEQSRNLIAELEKVEAEHEPSAQIIKHERKWMMGLLRSFDGIKTFVSACSAARSLNPSKTAQKNFLVEYDARMHRALQLQAKIAAHAYALEKGRLPTKWNEVVPAYLKSVPNVPFGPSDTNRLNFTSDYYIQFFQH
jgi:hypothetical protein